MQVTKEEAETRQILGVYKRLQTYFPEMAFLQWPEKYYLMIIGRILEK